MQESLAFFNEIDLHFDTEGCPLRQECRDQWSLYRNGLIAYPPQIILMMGEMIIHPHHHLVARDNSPHFHIPILTHSK